MKRLYFVACLLAIFFSCQKPSRPSPSFFQDIDPAFEPHWQSFKDEVAARNLPSSTYEQNISIQFAAGNESFRGQCNEIGGDSIIINRASWDTLDEVKREMLIFHEIGHCQLAREHEEEGGYFLNHSVAHSLMIPSLDGTNAVFDPYSPKWRTYYIDELFGLSNEPDWLNMGIPLDRFENTTETIFEITNIATTGASSPRVNLENETSFQAVFRNSSNEDITIIANDIKLKYSYEFSGFVIHRNNQLLATVNYFWYSNQIRPTGNHIITLRYVDDYIYFYVGDYLVHFREYPKPASMNLAIQSTGGALDARIAVERL